MAADEGGATIILAAVLFPVLIGAMGLGTEAGYWYLSQRRLQHAADVSAHAAAVRKSAGDPESRMRTVASHVAVESGLPSGKGTITVNVPPTSGADAGRANSVEVILSETQPLLLSSVFVEEPVTVRARAVARLDPGAQACVLALSPTAPGAVTVAGSTTVTLNGCDLASNSTAPDSVAMQGSGAVAADCVHSAGGAVTTTNLRLQKCDAVRTGAPKITDPYADVPEPSMVGSCRGPSTIDRTTTLVPQELSHASGLPVLCFPQGLHVRGGTVTFPRGLYIIQGGDLEVNANTVVQGEEVTFYFTDGAGLKLNGGAKINLSAPTSGPYSGLLFFGSRTNSAAVNQVNGASGSTFDGAIYFPSSELAYSGNSGVAGGCTQIIGRTVTFTGNSEVRSDCLAKGARPIVTDMTVRLVE
jgi:Flp pilus assembly protein TadG